MQGPFILGIQGRPFLGAECGLRLKTEKKINIRMCISGGKKNSRCEDSKAETSLVLVEEHTMAASKSDAKAQVGNEARTVGRAQMACCPGP